MVKYGMRPVHPGEVLREEYLLPLNLSTAFLAEHLHIPKASIDEVVNERRAVDAHLALLLARFFQSDAQSWMNLQTTYDLRKADQDKKLQRALHDVLPFDLASA